MSFDVRLGSFSGSFSVFSFGFIANSSNKGSYLWTKQNALHVFEGQGNTFLDNDSYSLEIVPEKIYRPTKTYASPQNHLQEWLILCCWEMPKKGYKDGFMELWLIAGSWINKYPLYLKADLPKHSLPLGSVGSLGISKGWAGLIVPHLFSWPAGHAAALCSRYVCGLDLSWILEMPLTSAVTRQPLHVPLLQVFFINPPWDKVSV